jgi:hypothetical protein
MALDDRVGISTRSARNPTRKSVQASKVVGHFAKTDVRQLAKGQRRSSTSEFFENGSSRGKHPGDG